VKASPDDTVFPSATGNPDGAMLEKLKAVAWRGKLNCGRCEVEHVLADGSRRINRCSSGPYCTRWFLLKFRHTYATRHLQDGIDIRTLQQWIATVILPRRWFILRASATATYRHGSTRATWPLSRRREALCRLCFAKIPCALKIARFPAAMAASSRLSFHPRTPRICPGGPRAAIPVYKDGGALTFSRRDVGSD
jgi:hypothetical protein